MAIHDIGDLVTLWAVFRDEDGTQTDPTTVELTLREPDGTVNDVSVSAAAAEDETLAETATGETLSGVTGVYRADVDVTSAGRWRYRWDGTGDVQEAGQGFFVVRPDMVGEVES